MIQQNRSNSKTISLLNVVCMLLHAYTKNTCLLKCLVRPPCSEDVCQCGHASNIRISK